MAKYNKFSDDLQELAWHLHDISMGREELTPELLERIQTALQRSANIVSTFEIRSQSLNNLRNEVDRYMDEFNTLIDQ